MFPPLEPGGPPKVDESELGWDVGLCLRLAQLEIMKGRVAKTERPNAVKIYVVYESTGSTDPHFAEEVGRDLRPFGDVTVGSTEAIGPVLAAEGDLVVVGGSDQAQDATGPRIRDWLENVTLARGDKEPLVITGSAAKGIAKKLGASSADQLRSIAPCLQM